MRKTLITALAVLAAITVSADKFVRVTKTNGTNKDTNLEKFQKIDFTQSSGTDVLQLTTAVGKKTTTTKFDVADVDELTFFETRDRLDSTVKEIIYNVKSNRIVGGYVAYYGGGGGTGALPVAKYHTHIFYSNAEPVMNADNTFNRIMIQTGYNDCRRLKACVNLKQQNPNLKVLISFGNSTVNGGFSRLCKSATARTAFCNACVDLVNQYSLDGIDLDWEFPGMQSNTYEYDTQVDVDNFSLLMQELYGKLHPLGKLLTIAGALEDKKLLPDGGYKYIDLAAIEPYVDFINVMMYDQDRVPQPHNGLYAPGAACDIVRTYQAYEDAGFPMQKLVMGLPFYGRHSYDSKEEDGGELYYKNIVAGIKSGKYNEGWNDQWKVPFITRNNQIWATYDNPRSIAAKADYVLNKGMRGVMYWEVSGDNGSELQQACWNSVLGASVPETITVYTYDVKEVTDTLFSSEGKDFPDPTPAPKPDPTPVPGPTPGPDPEPTCTSNPYGWTSGEDMYQALAADIWASQNNGVTGWGFSGSFSGTFGAATTAHDVSGISVDIQTFDLSFFSTGSYATKWGWLLNYINSRCAADGKADTNSDSPNAVIRYNLAAFFANGVSNEWPATADFTSYGANSTQYESTWGYSLCR